MQVRVLVDGLYNGVDHKAQRAKIGQLIEVAGGAYVASLVEDGFVELPTPGPSETQVAPGPGERKTTPLGTADDGRQATDDGDAAPDGDGLGLEDLDGVGPKTVEKLNAAGVDSLDALMAAPAADLLAAGFKVEDIERWKLQALALVVGA
jgi:predicted flap endonuclease-1-like 5' DNA nuclease